MALRQLDVGTIGAAAVVAGVALAVLGTVLLVVGGLLGSDGTAAEVEAGGVVFVGPIPIVVGTGRGVVWIALAITALMLLYYSFVIR